MTDKTLDALSNVALASALTGCAEAIHKVLIAGGDYGDELSDHGLRETLRIARNNAEAVLKNLPATSALREGPVRTPEEVFKDQGEKLVGMANAIGLNLTIHRQPKLPLAMRHVESVVTVWPAKW